ncbi:MAG TPA: aminotransferase class IV [Candidatus Angelobacter sp.]|nr:aminotransferase class IV [Candidatus Angelobacter sp.]
MAEGVAFVEGKYIPANEARMAVFDLGFMRGDAVYDTTSVWKGNFFRLDDHVARFLRSAAGMRLKCPYEPAQLKRILATCVQRAGLESSYVQMIMTRGTYQSLTNRDPRLCENRFIAYALPYIWIISPEKQETGINLAIVDNRRTPTEAIDPNIKNFNWMDLQRGLFEALDRGADHAVLCTPAGLLAEGPGFNFFLIKDKKLLTPKSNMLEGITRQTVFDLAGELGVPCTAADLPPDALREADEAFLSSTAGGIMPVTQVDGKPLGNGAPGLLTTELRTRYWQKREAGWLGTPVRELVEMEAVAGTA